MAVRLGSWDSTVGSRCFDLTIYAWRFTVKIEQEAPPAPLSAYGCPPTAAEAPQLGLPRPESVSCALLAEASAAAPGAGQAPA